MANVRASVLGGTVIFTGLAFVSCGGGNPMAPSAPATIEGTVNAAPSVLGTSDVTASAAHSGAGVTVSVVGMSVSTTTDSFGHFVLTGLPAGMVTLRFEGPGIDATLEISGLAAGQTLTISVQASGNRATLVTSPVASPSPSPFPSPLAQQCPDVGEKAEIEGTITEVSGMVQGVDVAAADELGTITVFQQGAVKGDYLCHLSSTTSIRHGHTAMTLDQLRVGSRVHVAGSGLGNASGTCEVQADEVLVQQP
jgi:hypothetical protein